MQNQSALDRVVAAFEHWRQTRCNSGARIPESLRRQSVALLDHYPLTQIIQALRLNSTQLKTWSNQLNDDEVSAPTFIALPVEQNPCGSLNLEVTLPGGGQLQLQGDIHPELLCALTEVLMSGPRASS